MGIDQLVGTAHFTRDDLTSAITEALTEAGGRLFGTPTRPGILHALERYVAKASTALPVFNYSVGTTSVKIAERDDTRIELLIANLGAATVYVGSRSDVTTGAAGDPQGGFPIFSNTIVSFARINSELYAISGSSAQDVRVLDLSAG